MDVVYEKQPQKMLMKMPRGTAEALMDKIAAFAANPRQAQVDVKKMKGMEDAWRVRQGSWRAILVKTDEVWIVEKIGSRGDVYK